MTISKRVAEKASIIAANNSQSVQGDSRYKLSKLVKDLGLPEGSPLDDVYKEVKKAMIAQPGRGDDFKELSGYVKAFGEAVDDDNATVPNIFDSSNTVKKYSTSLQELFTKMTDNASTTKIIATTKISAIAKPVVFDTEYKTPADFKTDASTTAEYLNDIDAAFTATVTTSNAVEIFAGFQIDTTKYANINTGVIDDVITTTTPDYKLISDMVPAFVSGTPLTMINPTGAVAGTAVGVTGNTELYLATKILYQYIFANASKTGTDSLATKLIDGFTAINSLCAGGTALSNANCSTDTVAVLLAMGAELIAGSGNTALALAATTTFNALNAVKNDAMAFSVAGMKSPSTFISDAYTTASYLDNVLTIDSNAFANAVTGANASELFNKVGINTELFANINTGMIQSEAGTTPADWMQINTFVPAFVVDGMNDMPYPAVDVTGTPAATKKTQLDLATKILYTVILDAQGTTDGVKGLITSQFCTENNYPITQTCTQKTGMQSDGTTLISPDSLLKNVPYALQLFKAFKDAATTLGIDVPSGFPNQTLKLSTVIGKADGIHLTDTHKNTGSDSLNILEAIVGTDMATILISAVDNDTVTFPTTADIQTAIASNISDDSLMIKIASNISKTGLLDFSAGTNKYIAGYSSSNEETCAQYKFYASTVLNKCGILPEPFYIANNYSKNSPDVTGGTKDCIESFWKFSKHILELTNCGKDEIAAGTDNTACKSDMAGTDLYSYIIGESLDPMIDHAIVTVDQINC